MLGGKPMCRTAIFILIVVAAMGQEQKERAPLRAFCIPSSPVISPGGKVGILCVLTNETTDVVTVSMFRGFAYTQWRERVALTPLSTNAAGAITYLGSKGGGSVSGRELDRTLRPEDFVRLRPGTSYTQEQVLTIPDDIAGTAIVYRATFVAENDGSSFGFLAWTGSVKSAEVEIRVERPDK